MPIFHRIGIVVFFTAYFILGYKGIQFMAPYLPHPITLTLPYEDQIPFVPLSILIYSTVYITPAVAFLLAKRRGHLFKTFVAFFIVSVIHFTIFALIPVKYEMRPFIPPSFDFSINTLVYYLYLVDDPINCFPSLHVSFAFLSYFCVLRFKPELGKVFLILALAVALSTLLVKQHYILDVLAALVVASIINFVFISKRFTKSSTFF